MNSTAQILFDATDINLLISRFDTVELRREIRNAERLIKFARDDDNDNLIGFYKDYIEAAKLAANIEEWLNTDPIIQHYNQQKPFKESIASVKSRFDLADFVGQYVKLRKSGNRYYGLCPLHSDKRTESLVIYPNQSWHCFGACNKSGDIINFVMEYYHLDIKGALSKLSR